MIYGNYPSDEVPSTLTAGRHLSRKSLISRALTVWHTNC